MPKKGSVVRDSFEQLVELGQTTAKKTVKQVSQTFSPLKVFEQITSSEETDPDQERLRKKLEKENGKNHSPVDFENLQEKYKKQDAQKEAAVRARLFQLSRQEEEKVLIEKKQKKQKEEQEELREEEEKKRREEEKKKQQEETLAPRGKQRKSIFSPKKKAAEQHTETRPATGKQ